MIGSQTCQLLALEPNLPETFVYGPQERTYRIELLKIDRTYAAKPRRATLGTTARQAPLEEARQSGAPGPVAAKRPARNPPNAVSRGVTTPARAEGSPESRTTSRTAALPDRRSATPGPSRLLDAVQLR